MSAKDIVPIDNEKNDAFTRILRFYTHADIVLNAEEDKILTRLIHCNSLLRSRKYKTDDIEKNIIEKFSVSKFTAQKDIRDTYALFGQIQVVSKQFILSHNIERMQIKIEQWENDKSLAHLVPKMYAELTRMASALENEVSKKELPTPNIHIVSLTVNNNSDTSKPRISIEEAKEKWKQKKALQSHTEDIDHEDVK